MTTRPLASHALRRAFRRALARTPLAAGALSLVTGLGLAVAQEGQPLETAPEAAGTPGEVLPDGSYVVKTGDTLWDLSQQFLQNPWYWPKIWAENPEIENPHWIYPGNRLRMKAAGAGAPVEVAPVEEDQPSESPDEPLAPRRREVADFSTGSIDRADDLGAGDDLVSIAGERLNPNNGRLGAIVPGIIRTGGAESLGAIGGSFQPKDMLCVGDVVTLELKDAAKGRQGARFAIVRDREEVRHPATGAIVGRYAELLGSVVVQGKNGDAIEGRIDACRTDIARGDLLVPYRDLFRPVQRRDVNKKLDGAIIYTAFEKQTIMGEQNIVFIDRGSKDGVADGAIFTVYQFGDGLKRVEQPSSKAGPREAVGQLIVVDTGEATSAAVVVQSVRDINVGDTLGLGLPDGAGGDAP